MWEPRRLTTLWASTACYTDGRYHCLMMKHSQMFEAQFIVCLAFRCTSSVSCSYRSLLERNAIWWKPSRPYFPLCCHTSRYIVSVRKPACLILVRRIYEHLTNRHPLKRMHSGLHTLEVQLIRDL
jgi:hypothetical protein